jgi:hypothetical protein
MPFLPADALHGRHATDHPSRLVAALRRAMAPARRELPRRPAAVPPGDVRPAGRMTLLPNANK